MTRTKPHGMHHGIHVREVACANAPNETDMADDAAFAYRESGTGGGIQMSFFDDLVTVVDDWGFRVVDGIAARDRVVAIAYRGVDASERSLGGEICCVATNALFYFTNGCTTAGERRFGTTDHLSKSLTASHSQRYGDRRYSNGHASATAAARPDPARTDLLSSGPTCRPRPLILSAFLPGN